MKKLLSMVICIAMLLSLLAACGGSTTNTSAPAADTKAEEKAETPAAESKPAEEKKEEATAAATDAKVEISYINWNGGEEMRLQQEAIAEYMEKNPNVTINGQWVTENYSSKINTLIAADQTPDIYYIEEYLAVDWGEKGVALDLAPLWASMGVDMKATYVSSAIFTYQDKVYGVSTGPVCGLLYYNKPMFDEAGIEYPSTDPLKPWTWEQFMDAAKKLAVDTAGNKPGDAGFKPKQMKAYGTLVPSFWLFVQPLLYSADSGFSNADGTATGLDSEGGRKALTGIYDAINTLQVAPDAAVAKTLPGATQAFKNKQVGMTISGTWEYQNFMKEDIDFGIAPLPSFGKPSNISWAATNQISAKTKNPAEVAKFLNFLTDPDSNPRQLEINFPNKIDWYNDQTKFDSWIQNGNFKDDFKVVIPKIMTEVAVVPENVTLKNFNKLVGEIAQGEIDKYLANSQDLDTTINNIKQASEGQWQGKW